MSKTAIIILDMQNCFITQKTKPLIAKIKKHLETNNYDLILFSKFINVENSNFIKKVKWHKCKTSPETDIVKELSEIATKNHIVEKNTYSLFKSKPFTNLLNENNSTKLFLCGLDIDACILASAFEAFDIGYDFEILLELTSSSAKSEITSSAQQIIKRNLQN